MAKLQTRMTRFYPALALSVLVLGCDFDPSVDSPEDGAPGAVDASMATPDAAPISTDAPLGGPDASTPNCGWPYTPVHFDPCVHAPPGPYEVQTLTRTDGPYVYYTSGAGALLDPDGNAIPHTDTTVNGLKMLWVSELTITTGAILRVIGSRPLLIASQSDIDVLGTLDASSYWDAGRANYEVGAGSQPFACANAPVEMGDTCGEHGGGGGGGGGFGGAGGTGGEGASNHNCEDGTFGAQGGAGGGAVAVPETSLRGGCAGGDGGEGNGSDTAGVGGPGGGAVHLSAADQIFIRGLIHVGGAGGRGSSGDRAAGGGGGSGGMIGLEADALIFDSAAVLSANGGGGGGGSNNAVAAAGQDARADGSQAVGGSGEAGQGSDGGDGGWLGGPAGETAAPSPSRGGGGGGGGVGYILYHGVTPIGDALRVSPAPVLVP